MDGTLERIAVAFAEAVVAGRYDRAAGWLEIARWSAARSGHPEDADALLRLWSPDAGEPRPLAASQRG